MGVRARVGQVPAVRLGQLGAIAVLGVSALFGGLDEVTPPGLPGLAPGTVHEGPQLHVAVDKAVLADTLPPLPDPEEGQRYLAVGTTIENRDVRPAAALGETLVLESVTGYEVVEPAPDVALISDGSSPVELQPGMKDRVAFVWLVEPAEANDDEPADEPTVEIVVQDKTLITETTVMFGPTWIDPLPAARVMLPLEEAES